MIAKNLLIFRRIALERAYSSNINGEVDVGGVLAAAEPQHPSSKHLNRSWS